MSIFRFAPSPNGYLHLGHAYSALLNFDMARSSGGKLLLRFEDIDDQRCSPEYESAILKDLEWLEIEWSGTPRRQSEHYDEYKAILKKLEEQGLLYPSFLSRSQIKQAAQRTKQHIDPDGSPHYPGDERDWSAEKIKEALQTHERYSQRLNISKAKKLFFSSKNSNLSEWGDIVLGRSDCPASYHLCVVVDDALSGITHIVRGEDLQPATSLHLLLQSILDYPTPIYHHHRLICDDQGRKLSKSEGDVALSHWRNKGMKAQDIREHLGLET